jgi:16S rRNA processing protein RimM
MAKPTERWVHVGVLGRAHGVRGELYAHLVNSESALLAVGRRLRVGDEGEGVEMTVVRAQAVPRGWLVCFEGVGDRDAAAALTTRKLYVARAELPALDPDEFYQDDLVGLRAVDTLGRELGVITGFFHSGAHEVCVLRTPSGDEALVPFHDEVLVEVSFDEEEVVLELPEGLPGLPGAGDESPDGGDVDSER